MTDNPPKQKVHRCNLPVTVLHCCKPSVIGMGVFSLSASRRNKQRNISVIQENHSHLRVEIYSQIANIFDCWYSNISNFQVNFPKFHLLMFRYKHYEFRLAVIQLEIISEHPCFQCLDTTTIIIVFPWHAPCPLGILGPNQYITVCYRQTYDNYCHNPAKYV